MAGSTHDLGEYIEVKDRIALFYEKYPDGAIQGEWKEVWIGDEDGSRFIVYKAYVYREAGDVVPTHGTAWEPFPGKTPFTRNSELMNAETSAVGRAIANLGIGIANSMASKNEILNRKDEPVPPKQVTKAKVKALVTTVKDKEIDHETLCFAFAKAGADAPTADTPEARATAFFALTAEQADKLEGVLKDG